MNTITPLEKSACGVGFVKLVESVCRTNIYNRVYRHYAVSNIAELVERIKLPATVPVSWQDIPFELLDIDRNTTAVATLFFSGHGERRRKAMAVLRILFIFLEWK